MKNINVAEASGRVLDWLVAKCESLPLRLDPMGFSTDAPDSAEAGWWVWLAQPGSMLIGPGGDTTSRRRYSPSTNWAQGGPIIDREHIHIRPTFTEGGYRTAESTDAVHATIELPNGATVYDHKKVVWEYGPTPLIAAMRCYVASKLGETAEVPEALL